jgi:hypothetical protein
MLFMDYFKLSERDEIFYSMKDSSDHVTLKGGGPVKGKLQHSFGEVDFSKFKYNFLNGNKIQASKVHTGGLSAAMVVLMWNQERNSKLMYSRDPVYEWICALENAQKSLNKSLWMRQVIRPG